MKILKLIASLGISFSAAALGSIATTSNIPTWYAGLQKPFFNPPNWVFGPVWTVLYTLIGISMYLVWINDTRKPKKRAYIFFGLQMVLNAAWSIVFFGLHQTLRQQRLTFPWGQGSDWMHGSTRSSPCIASKSTT